MNELKVVKMRVTVRVGVGRNWRVKGFKGEIERVSGQEYDN